MTHSLFALTIFFAATFLGMPTPSAQESFRQTQIELGKKKLNVELATTPALRERGLMNRTKLDVDGMLFVFPETDIRSFWMKSTFIDLDLGFFSEKGQLLEIAQLKGVKSEAQAEIPRYTSQLPAKYVLEVPMGWFKKNKISIGESLKIPKNSDLGLVK